MSYRLQIWSEAVSIGMKNWILGSGYDPKFEIVVDENLRFDHPHNVFIEAFMMGGVCSVIFYILAFAHPLVALYEINNNREIKIMTTMLIFSIVVQQFVAGKQFGKFVEFWYYAYLPLAMCIHYVVINRRRIEVNH